METWRGCDKWDEVRPWRGAVSPGRGNWNQLLPVSLWFSYPKVSTLFFTTSSLPWCSPNHRPKRKGSGDHGLKPFEFTSFFISCLFQANIIPQSWSLKSLQLDLNHIDFNSKERAKSFFKSTLKNTSAHFQPQTSGLVFLPQFPNRTLSGSVSNEQGKWVTILEMMLRFKASAWRWGLLTWTAWCPWTGHWWRIFWSGFSQYRETWGVEFLENEGLNLVAAQQEWRNHWLKGIKKQMKKIWAN